MKRFEKYQTDSGLLALSPVPHPVDPGRWPMWRDEADSIHRHSLCEILYKILEPTDWAWYDKKYVKDIYRFYSNPQGMLRRGSEEPHWPSEWHRVSRDLLIHFLSACCFLDPDKIDAMYLQRLQKCVEEIGVFMSDRKFSNQGYEETFGDVLTLDFQALRHRAEINLRMRKPGLFSYAVRLLGDAWMCVDSLIWNRKPREKTDINSHFLMTLSSLKVKTTFLASFNYFLLDWDGCRDRLAAYHTFHKSIRDFVGPIEWVIDKVKRGDDL